LVHRVIEERNSKTCIPDSGDPQKLRGLEGSEGEALVQTLAAQAPTWLVQFPAVLKPEHRETLQRELPGATRKRMLREIGAVLEAITSEIPLLLVFEGLQWADQSTVDFIFTWHADGRLPS
jgi:predicted ATPase